MACCLLFGARHLIKRVSARQAGQKIQASPQPAKALKPHIPPISPSHATRAACLNIFWPHNCIFDDAHRHTVRAGGLALFVGVLGAGPRNACALN